MSYRLKLTKARSYTRGSVTVTQEKPFADVEDAKTAEALLASGYFTLVSSTNEAEAEPEPESGAESKANSGETLKILTGRNCRNGKTGRSVNSRRT